VFMLEGRDDMAVLWDIRIHPEYLRQGCGSRLFSRAATWAHTKGCGMLKVETQNINVAACNFYASQGCELGGINRFAHPEFLDEVQLLWYKRL
jgi:GNAT superfamily N-acetyltransferase